jgi:hypothetical protein
VTDGLQTTWNVLTQTRNRAAVPVLAAALESRATDIHADAVRASVHRKDTASHEQIIRRFKQLGDGEQQVLRAAHREAPYRMAAALSAAVLHGDAEQCENACRIVVECQDYDLLPVLVRAAENRKHRHLVQVSSAMLQLANRLHQHLAGPNENTYVGQRNLFFVRRQAVRALERSLADYAKHQRLEILEAFLLVAPAENAMLERIVQDTRHPCHQQVLSSLSSSKVPALMEHLVTLLDDPSAPLGVLQIIAERTDRRFLDLLLHELTPTAPPRVLQNVARLDRVAWLESERELLLDLDGPAQAVAVELAVESGIGRSAVFELLAMFMRRGRPEARRASCRALVGFCSSEADSLVLAAVTDPDPGVQAAAAAQLRQRHAPNALPMLVRLLDSPAAEVRDAARSSLAEFNFVRYRAMFEMLDEKTLRTTGVLVRKVDPSCFFRLTEDLASPSATTRRRGMAMAIAMDATMEVRDKLIMLAEDEDAAVRLEAVMALGLCRGREVVSALQMAAHDPHFTVGDAAAKSLEQVRTRDPAASRGTYAAGVSS